MCVYEVYHLFFVHSSNYGHFGYLLLGDGEEAKTSVTGVILDSKPPQGHLANRANSEF